MQVYTLEQAKRGLCPYDDKRFLLADLPDGSPNPDTHAYGHRALRDEVHVDTVPAEAPGADLIVRRAVHVDAEHTANSIKRVEQRAKDNHARVVKKVTKLRRTRRDSNGETIDDDMGDNQPVVPNGDANGELHGNDLALAERAAAARPGTRGRLDNVIDLIARMNHIKVPTSPPPRIPPRTRVPTHGAACQSNLSQAAAACQSPHTLGYFCQLPPTQRAGPSGTFRPPPAKVARAILRESSIDSDDGQDPVPRPAWPPAPVRSLLSSGDEEPTAVAPVEYAAAASQVFLPPPWTSVVPRSQLPPDSESDDEPPIRRRRAARRRVNPFIDAEAGVDGDASADEDDESDADLDGFIVGDDVDD